MDASGRTMSDLKAAIVEGVTATHGDDIGTILGGSIVAYAGVTKNQMMYVTMHKRITEFEDQDSGREEGPPHRLVMGYSWRKKAFTVLKLEPGLDEYNTSYSRLSSGITKVPMTDDIYILRLATGFGTTDYLINARKKTSEHLMYHNMDPDQFEVTITFKDTDVFE
jgi:hypothetical protein